MTDERFVTARPAFLAGGGAAGALLRGHDWPGSPLGEQAAWPPALQTLAGVVLASTQPLAIAWGAQGVLLYNDAFAVILGDRHPASLGRPYGEVWPGDGDIRRALERAFAGEPVRTDPIATGSGEPGLRHFVVACTPVPDAAGAVAGVLCAATEVTAQLQAEAQVRELTGTAERRAAEREAAAESLRAERDRNRGILDRIGEGVVLLDHAFRVTEINAAGLRIDGRPADQILGRHLLEVWPEAEDYPIWPAYQRAMTERAPMALEHRYVSDRQDVWLDVRAYPVPEGDGGLAVFYRNVTDSRRTEARLHESEAWRARLLATTPAGIVELDANGCIAYANAAAERILGAKPGELLGRRHDDPAWQPLSPHGAPIPRDRLPGAVALRGETVRDYEQAITRLDGGSAVVLVDAVPVRGGVAAESPDGPVQGALAAFQDVTARHEAARALAVNEAQLRVERGLLEAVLRQAPLGISVAEAPSGRALLLNRRARHLLGRGDERGDKRHFDGLGAIFPDGRPYAVNDYPTMRALAGEVVEREAMLFRRDGLPETETMFLEVSSAPVRDEAGAIVAAVTVFADVAQQRRAEAALRESEARFRHMADSAPALIWMTDESGRVTFANMHFGHISGRHPSEMLGVGWASIVLPEDIGPFRTIFADAFRVRQPFRTEVRIRDKQGHIRWMRLDGVPRLDDGGRFLGYTGCGVDITDARVLADELERRVEERTAELSEALGRLHQEIQERERAEEALQQAQKMEAIGQLTGGIAHDFNNMLQAIGGALELIRGRLERGQTAGAARYAEIAHETVDRAAALTHRLLAFARRQQLQPRPVDPNELVAGMAELVRRAVGPGVAVELSLHDGAWSVLCDPSQLESALLNLAINARDAMPDGGRLTLRTADVRLRPGDLAGEDGIAPGDYVEIAVADTGAGMDAATRARAFEPFFTTKPIGQGTGLGLSQVYGFVRQSGGLARLDSAPGRGTTVRLLLPRHGQEGDHAQVARTATRPVRTDGKMASVAGTVLLVEDEAGVRDVAAARLRELGCHVIEAADGPAALQALQAGDGLTVDLLVTDVGLPGGLNGRQVANLARERAPDLPVLFITGYAGGALDEHLAPGMAVLGKPFTLDALAERIRAILSNP